MTERTLLRGPSFRTLEDTAFEWAAERADPGINRVLYITGASTRRERIQDRWAASHSRLSLRTETLTSVVSDCFEELVGPGSTLPSHISTRAIEFGLDQVLEDAEWLSTESLASAELANAFEQRFARFANVGLYTPDAVKEEFAESTLDSRIRETTVRAFEEFDALRQKASEPWHYLRGEAYDTVSESNLDDLLPHVDAIIISGYLEFGAVERRLVNSIAATIPTVALLPSFSQAGTEGVDSALTTIVDDFESMGFEDRWVAPDSPHSRHDTASKLYRNRPPDEKSIPDGVTWRELPTPEREIRFVARELRTDLADGVDPSSIGVVVPGLHAYNGYIEDIFDVYDIPHVLPGEVALGETHVGDAVINLIELAERPPRATDLTELVVNPVVEVVDLEWESDIIAAERRVDSTRLETVLEELSPEVRRLVNELLNDVQSLQEEGLESAIDTIETLLDEFHLGERVADDERQIDTAQEQSALKEVTQIFESLRSPAIPPRDRSPIPVMLRALESGTVQAYQARGERVQVLTHRDANTWIFDRLYLVGLTVDHFPAVTRYPSFFERMTEAHPILELVDDRTRDRHTFAMLLGHAHQVTLTTPSTEQDSSAVVLSPILDELSRVTDIEADSGVDTRNGSREDLQRAISAQDNRRGALDTAGQRGDFSPEQTIRADRGIACAVRRKQPIQSPYDGVLEPDTVTEMYPEADREPYSASRIERYVNCGFQFYMEHLLGIDDSESVERTPDPLEQGAYVHDTLERFFADLQTVPGEQVDINTYTHEELESHMLTVALDELSAAEFEYSGLFYRHWLEKLFAGLGTPETNPYYGSSRPHPGIEEGLFLRFIERERNRPADHLPTWFEEPFGEGLYGYDDLEPFEIALPDGDSIPLRGFIDRVDIGANENGVSLQLFDYKTGSLPSMTETTGGTKFQLPLYLLAAEDVLTSKVDAPATLSATYYQVKPPNSLHDPRGVESKFDSPEELRRFLDEEIPARLETVNTAMKNGQFQTTYLPARDAGCGNCSYRRACDVRHHHRRERVSRAQEESQTYVPIRATTKSFDEQFRGDDDE